MLRARTLMVGPITSQRRLARRATVEPKAYALVLRWVRSAKTKKVGITILGKYTYKTDTSDRPSRVLTGSAQTPCRCLAGGAYPAIPRHPLACVSIDFLDVSNSSVPEPFKVRPDSLHMAPRDKPHRTLSSEKRQKSHF